MSVIDTGHLDRNLAARDLASWQRSGRLSRLGQAWHATATKLQRNVATRKYQVGGTIVTRRHILRILMQQEYRCPITGRPFDPRLRAGPWQPSIDRIDNGRGYYPENIRIVAYIANLAMNVWGEAPLVEMAEHIVAPRLRPTEGVERRPLKLTTPVTLVKQKPKRYPARKSLPSEPISHTLAAAMSDDTESAVEKGLKGDAVGQSGARHTPE